MAEKPAYLTPQQVADILAELRQFKAEAEADYDYGTGASASRANAYEHAIELIEAAQSAPSVMEVNDAE